MSQLDELLEAVTTAVTMASEGVMHTGNAEGLCTRITASGAEIGFGNDPVLIRSAQEKITAALAILYTAAAELETAQTYIRQAKEQS